MKKFYDEISGRTLCFRPDPQVISNVFEEEYFSYLIDTFKNIRETNILKYTDFLGRYYISTLDSSIDNPLLQSFDHIIDRAKILFGDHIKPTYAVWGLYRGFKAALPKHIDDNACTYTMDVCLSQIQKWPIYVEDKEYILEPNQALCYYGEDQYHWRNQFPDPAKNEVEMIFFHFAEPDHWFFTKGPKYQQEIIRLRWEHQKRNETKV